MSSELIIFKFPAVTGADDMVKLLKSFQAQNFVEVKDAIVAMKYDEQRVEVRQALNSGRGKGAAAGALAGALLGLPSGPAGAAIGLAAGALTGRVAEATREPGAQSQEIESLVHYELQPGESILLVYADPVWSAQIEQIARDVDTAVYRRSQSQFAGVDATEGIEIYKATLVTTYRSWEEELAHARVELALLRDRAAAAAQAERAGIQRQMAEAKARIDQFYQNVLRTLDVRRQQIDTELARLEAAVKGAQAQAKADIERQIAAAQEAQETLRMQIDETLSQWLNDLQADTENLKAQVAKSSSETRAAWEARIAALEAQMEANQKRLAQLHKARGAAWGDLRQSVAEAVKAYRETLRKAEDEFRN
ncbi:MAG: DUF1269 domain-containing protein [Caldilineaceae bacterium]|nr:DUF1269 domain-containing protein [Caldilineaceae bacterium]